MDPALKVTKEAVNKGESVLWFAMYKNIAI